GLLECGGDRSAAVTVLARRGRAEGEAVSGASPRKPSRLPAGRTARLSAWARNGLVPLVYDELRRIADRYLAAEPRGNTLQPTALAHEAYMRLVGPSDSG